MLDQLYTCLHDELARSIARTRGGKHAGTIATKLLSNDQSGSLLVGIVEDGSVVEYSRSTWSLRLVPITEEGELDGGGASFVERKRSVRLVEEWVSESSGELLVWVHPRFRWVLNDKE